MPACASVRRAPSSEDSVNLVANKRLQPRHGGQRWRQRCYPCLNQMGFCQVQVLQL